MLRYLGAALVAALLFVACHTIAGVDELVPKDLESNPDCEIDADCGDPTICRMVECTDGTCVPRNSDPGTLCNINGTCDGEGYCHCPAAGCADEANCDYDTQCESGYCEMGTCKPALCGGPCVSACMKCHEGGTECVPVEEGDPAKGACEEGCDGEGGCPSCSDGLTNGHETGLNCGGPSCPPCADDEPCDGPSDCQSCLCEAKKCAAPECGNKQQDACETDVDCGGPCGSTCGPGEACRVKQDCASHWCEEFTCREGM